MTDRSRHPLFETAITLSGPVRRPRQVLADQTYGGHTSIHDDATAVELGFAGAPIEGPTHFSQLVPLLVTLWGPRWLESGSISAHFQNPCVEGDETVASIDVDRASDERVAISVAKVDGTPVLTGTAGVGSAVDHPEHEVRRRLASARAPGSLQILDQVELGPTPGGPEEVRMTFDEPLGALYPFALRRKLELITEPLAWYGEEASDNPWPAPIIPVEMISVLTQCTSDGRIPVRQPSVALFLDQEIAVHRGPLLVGVDYELDREVVALSSSRRTESFWTRTEVRAAGSAEVLATVLLHTGVLKDSYPHYAPSDEPVEGSTPPNPRSQG